jgi:hypothetical protein
MYVCRREKVSLPGFEAGWLFEHLDNRTARKSFGGAACSAIMALLRMMSYNDF